MNKERQDEIDLGRKLLSECSVEDINGIDNLHDGVSEELALFMVDLVKKHDIPLEHMGKIAINTGLACWTAGVIKKQHISNWEA